MMLERELSLVEEALWEALNSRVPFLAQAGRHLVEAGGKRLRPRLVLLSYHAAGGSGQHTAVRPAVRAAVAVELLHTASLVHDDINDGGTLRRGCPTVNHLWGDQVALLVGDFVYAQVLRMVTRCPPAVGRELASACLDLIEGEAHQALASRNGGIGKDDYLAIARQKTAALLGACTRMGALAAGAGPASVRALGDYGEALGISFQIRDDVLDLIGSPAAMGKPTVQDLNPGRPNLALLHAARACPEVQIALQAGDRDRVLTLVHDTGAVAFAQGQAKVYARKACEALSPLPLSDARRAMEELAAFAVERAG